MWERVAGACRRVAPAWSRYLGQPALSISLAAASIACATAALGGRPATFSTALLPFLCTFCVYNVDRLVDTRDGAAAVSSPARARTFRRRRGWIRAGVAGAFVAQVALAATQGLHVMLLVLAFPLAGALYVAPVIPSSRVRRLKDLPLLKAFYVPACWCLLVALAAELNQLSWRAPPTWFAVAFVYLRIFIGAYVGDLRDVDSDRAEGTRTLAACLGPGRSYRLLGAANAASVALVAAAVARRWTAPAALALIASCCVGWWVMLKFRARPEQRELLADIYDLEYVSYWPLLLLASP